MMNRPSEKATPGGQAGRCDSIATRKKVRATIIPPADAGVQHRPGSHPSRILAALLAGESLTAADAWRHYSCMRLASVIHALRRDGWQIEANTISVRTAAGRVAHVARYRMGGGHEIP
jgi:hypothetical protein